MKPHHLDSIFKHGQFDLKSTSKLADYPLIKLTAPILNFGFDALYAYADELITHEQHRFDLPTIVEDLLDMLIRRFAPIVEKAVVLEMHITREQDGLDGDSPEDRFQQFINQLATRENSLALLQKYPVMTRQLLERLAHWQQFCKAFLTHLVTDWYAIKYAFPALKLDQVSRIDSHVSDPHKQGRVVLILHLQSGAKLVYKPRGLQSAVHFQQMAQWCNDQGFHPELPTLAILDREDHGWVEYVNKQSCTSAAEVERFYERIGGFLALLYILNANDFHFENLIASGEYPYLIDFESLLVPTHSTIIDPELDDESDHASIAFSDLLVTESVLRVGLLPTRSVNPYGIDMSGLGDNTAELSAHKAPHWKNRFTDEMHLVREPLPVWGADNHPILNDHNDEDEADNTHKVSVLAYSDQVVSGFTQMYTLLSDHRADLLAADSPIRAFQHDQIRVILRNPQTYMRILEESHHPTLLQDALRRDQFFDYLWAAVIHQPYLERIILSEQDDLWNGDVPMFTTTPTSTAIWDSSGRCIPDFFTESGLSQVENMLKKLDEKDLAQQTWFIHASFTALGANTGNVFTESRPNTNNGSTPNALDDLTSVDVDHALLRAEAVKIGDHLLNVAVTKEDQLTWFGLDFVTENETALKPAGLSLYEGVPGIALFLAYLSEITGDQTYTDCARIALNTIMPKLEAFDADLSIGGFDGWGGVIYALVHLGTLWDDQSLLTLAEKIATEHIPQHINDDIYFDLITGSAGCLATLLVLYEVRPNPDILHIAVQCGERLVNEAQEMPVGIGWPTKNPALAGFSHGTAGIAWTLTRLTQITGNEAFWETAVDALLYERTLFSEQDQNWRDLRNGKERDTELASCVTTWCHGAPGIGLGRIGLLPYANTAQLRHEIQIAINTTVAHGFEQNHSLCHGSLGNIELLLQAKQHPDALPLIQAKQAYDEGITTIMNSIRQNGYLCGVPMGVETPGLMTGIAGIGYQLLRLAYPERVPSILTLEAPVNVG